MNDLVIAALTTRGLELGQRLAQGLEENAPVCVQQVNRQKLTELFLEGHSLVCVMALGIVVRVLGPLLHNKHKEPAVVVVDEAGRFAISVIGGHAAGANALVDRVARVIGAQAVITTASDVLGLPAVDLIGKERGWKIENPEHLTAVAAAVVNRGLIGVYQDVGFREWWQEFGAWPDNFQRLACWPAGDWSAVLVFSDRLHRTLPYAHLVYRPPSLALGVGCRRGVPCTEIEALFQEVCQGHGYSPLSLGVVATASIKADEPGLKEFAAQHAVPLESFSLEELDRVQPVPTPSERVRAKIGIAGVAEPAAMLAAGSTSLLMPKHRGHRVTMALARREDA